MKKAQLNLYITYSGEDAKNDVIHDLLQGLVEHAADTGLLSGYLHDLIVEESTFEIHISDGDQP